MVEDILKTDYKLILKAWELIKTYRDIAPDDDARWHEAIGRFEALFYGDGNVLNSAQKTFARRISMAALGLVSNEIDISPEESKK